MFVGIPARPQHMPLHVDGVFVVRRDRKDVHFVAVVDDERIELLFGIIGISARREIQCKHRPFFMGFDPLNLDMTQRSSGQDPPSEFQHFRQRVFAMQFIDGGTANHSVHGDLRAQRRNEQSVAILEPMEVGPYPVQE